MRRRVIISVCALSLVAVGAGGALFAINRAGDRMVESRFGPVHRFPVAAGASFLTDEYAAAVAREVMTRDGYPESAWKMREGARSKAPDGRPDRYLERNSITPNRGEISFDSDNSPTPVRYVNIEMGRTETTARGSLGK